MPRARIVALSHALPAGVVRNTDLAADYPEWRFDQLTPKTGVTSRHVAGADETTLDLAVQACETLFDKHGIERDSIDFLIFCTQTPDYIMPGNSSLLQHRLGLPTGMRCLDICHACSGYVQGLDVIRPFIETGTARRALLVAGDTYSKLIRDDDRSVRSLFGDGVSVTLVDAGPDDGPGLIDVTSGTDGRKFDFFYVPEGGFRQRGQAVSTITMNGFGVLSYFTKRMSDEVRAFLGKHDLGLDDIDRFVFHQASAVALNNLSRSLKLDPARLVIDMEDTGNLTSASIGVALERGIDKGQLQPGQLVLLCGFGVGLSWGLVLMRL